MKAVRADMPVFHGNPRGNKALELRFPVAREDARTLRGFIDERQHAQIVMIG